MMEYDIEEARELMHAEIDTGARMFGEGEFLGVVRGTLDDRRVDHKFRINNGILE